MMTKAVGEGDDQDDGAADEHCGAHEQELHAGKRCLPANMSSWSKN
jgi:hypothetical protein